MEQQTAVTNTLACARRPQKICGRPQDRDTGAPPRRIASRHGLPSLPSGSLGCCRRCRPGWSCQRCVCPADVPLAPIAAVRLRTGRTTEQQHSAMDDASLRCDSFSSARVTPDREPRSTIGHRCGHQHQVACRPQGHVSDPICPARATGHCEHATFRRAAGPEQ